MTVSSIFDDRMRGDFYNAGQLRRSTLTSLRWMAIAGQLAALAFVCFALKIDLPIFACIAVIAVSALVNIGIMVMAPLDRCVPNIEAGAQLLFDIMSLSLLLYLTGGIQNPFALLLLAPVVVAAKTLDWRVFASMTGAVAIISLLLLFYHMPLPWFSGESIDLPKTYNIGAWFALQVGMVFTSIYTWRATVQTRRITQALAATDAILAHEKTLSALGGLAAAAAHKLGTPLSTIQLIAKEISNTAKPDSELANDAILLQEQAQHCSDILKELGQRGDKGDIVHDQLNLADLIREITEPFVGLHAEIITDIIHPESGIDMPILTRKPEFVYGLTNIVENAADFANTEVRVKGTWSQDNISIEVTDDGPGFAASVLAKVGEPYISHRPNQQHSAGGMGLGVFIATVLIKRVGGTISFSNRKSTNGARVELCWPIEKPRRKWRKKISKK